MTYQRNETPEPLTSATPITEAFAALMPEPKYRVSSMLGRHLGFTADDHSVRKGSGLYTADQMREAIRAATEREREACAVVAQNMLDTEGEVGADDWNAEMGWDWACQQIRNAIRSRADAIRASGGMGASDGN